ncbi:MAG: DUF2145 domain-containing protein [Pseudomonadota bacterium]
MMLRRRWLPLLLALALTGPAWPGGPCQESPLPPAEVARAAAVAHAAFEHLEASGADLAIIARSGSDLRRHGLRYSHGGLVMREHERGPWTVVHLLNHCASSRSELFEEGLVNFFAAGLFALDAVILVPEATLQQGLLGLVRNGAVDRLHDPRYNRIAHPMSARFQNSNQWLLESIAIALADGTATRRSAQQYLAAAGYEGDRIRIGRFQRVVGGLTRDNLNFGDHPLGARIEGRYQVVTVRSLRTFLAERDLLAAVIEF